jgi:dihydroneopterin aldolase/2-amino-4-hydroxy-6-hydroxymethyldihydropteridine diphosphokinase
VSADEPVLDEQGRRLDQIRLTGIAATGFHGVLEEERRAGQPFVADVVVHLDTRRAAAGDDLSHTVDYGELARRVHAVLGGEPAALVETVAERIAATVLAHPGVQAVDVTVHKPAAPIEVPFDDVVVSIRRDRTKLPAAEPYREPATEVAPAPDEPPMSPVDGEVVLDQLDEPPAGPVDVVLALGANLGPAAETLRAAVAELSAVPGLQVTDVSPLARTAAVGGSGQPDYLNAVVLGRTTLAARELLRACHAIEDAHGRRREERWGPRTLDVDIVVYDTVLAVTDDLELPHPRAHQRAFVLAPWAEVDPEAVLPGLGGGPVAALAATAPDRDGIRWMALDWLTEPVPTTAPAPVASAPSAPPPPPPPAPTASTAPAPARHSFAERPPAAPPDEPPAQRQSDEPAERRLPFGVEPGDATRPFMPWPWEP